MEDKKISEAVELLFKGAKMLAYHCPACNMPLFKYEGRIICPACKKEAEIIEEGRDVVVRLKEDERESVIESKVDKEVESKKVEVVTSEKDENIEDLLKSVIRTVVSRLVDVATNEDITTIKDFVSVLDNLLNVLERVKRMKI